MCYNISISNNKNTIENKFILLNYRYIIQVLYMPSNQPNLNTIADKIREK